MPEVSLQKKLCQFFSILACRMPLLLIQPCYHMSWFRIRTDMQTKTKKEGLAKMKKWKFWPMLEAAADFDINTLLKLLSSYNIFELMA